MTEGSTRKERDREIDCFKVWAGLNENIFFLLEPRSLKASHHLPIVISLWRSSSPRLCLKKKPPDLSMAHRCSQGYSLQSVLPRTQPHSGGGWARQGSVFRQKVEILITEPGIQGELCSGREPSPATSNPGGLSLPQGWVEPMDLQIKVLLCLFFIMKTY